MERSLRALAFSVPFVLAGCGLALDYDPPTDAGFDAAIDAPRPDGGDPDASDPCGGCPAGEVCREGACWPACDGNGACSHDPTECERCQDGACRPADVACPGGSTCREAFCDTMTDGCTEDDTCPLGEACSGDACVPGACSTDDDCAMIVGGACGYFCPDGTCVPRPTPICPPIFAETCEAIDPCTCLGTGELEPGRCGAGTVCDPETFLCVACRNDAECIASGRGMRCELRTHECVECLHAGDCPSGEVCDPELFQCVECASDTDCERTGIGGPVCDLVAHECVGCLGDVDCPGGRCDRMTLTCVGCLSRADCPPTAPICEPSTRTCRPCIVGAIGECGLGERCEAGACVRAGCERNLDCPTYACAGPPTCVMTAGGGRCTYGALDDSRCGDGAACTFDSCDPTTSTDSSGCVHVPSDGACDDGFSCTLDVCVAGLFTGMTARCEHRPDDRLCSSGASLECGSRVCVGGEAGAVVETGTGCGLTYEPLRCPVGSYCDAAGQCRDAPACGGTFAECPDPGSPCLDPLLCVGGLCQQIPTGGDACDLLPSCATYCSATGCLPRTGADVPSTCAATTIP